MMEDIVRNLAYAEEETPKRMLSLSIRRRLVAGGLTPHHPQNEG